MAFKFHTCDWSGDLSVHHRYYYSGSVSNSRFVRNFESENAKSPHVNGKGCDDVRAIAINEILLKSIPSKLAKAFENLVALELVKCGLVGIEKKDLKPFPQLKDLWLGHNKIRVVPQDLFECSLLLEVVSFKNNEIKHVGEHLLKPLGSLLFVDFRCNISINSFYEKGSSMGVGLNQINSDIKTKCQPAYDAIPKASNTVRRLWETRRLSDFTIKVNGVEFNVHKNILSVNSPVFDAMFTSDQENRESEMEIVDFTTEAVQEFLEFLYVRTEPSVDNAMEVFAMAAKYQFEDLVEMSGNQMISGLNIDNAWEIFLLADANAEEFIKCSAFAVISSMFHDVKLPMKLMDQPTKLKKIIDEQKATNKILVEM